MMKHNMIYQVDAAMIGDGSNGPPPTVASMCDELQILVDNDGISVIVEPVTDIYNGAVNSEEVEALIPEALWLEALVSADA